MRRNHAAAAGFTLIELLVVIAIVAILASLLLPGLSQAKTKAQNVRCQNNLRQIGLGLTLYAGEQGRYPFMATYQSSGGPVPIWRGFWWDNLATYVVPSFTNSLYVCPLNQRRPPNRLPTPDRMNVWGEIQASYGYNGLGTGFSGKTRLPGLGVGGFANLAADGSPPLPDGYNAASLRDGGARSPVEFIVLGDATYTSLLLEPNHMTRMLADVAARSQSWFQELHWHKIGANTCFADGHVVFLKDAQLYEASESSRRLWNNDHEPHPETW